MHTLALDSSTPTASVALFRQSELIAQSVLNSSQRTAQTLAPAIASLLHAANWSPEDIELVGVTRGPGSFTGLRVGVMTAKTFCYAVDAEIIGVDTLDVIIEQAPQDANTICAVLDAHRQQLFVGPIRPLRLRLPPPGRAGRCHRFC